MSEKGLLYAILLGVIAIILLLIFRPSKRINQPFALSFTHVSGVIHCIITEVSESWPETNHKKRQQQQEQVIRLITSFDYICRNELKDIRRLNWRQGKDSFRTVRERELIRIINFLGGTYKLYSGHEIVYATTFGDYENFKKVLDGQRLTE